MTVLPVVGVYRGAFMRMQQVSMVMLLGLTVVALWVSLSGQTEGLVSWVVLGAALYLPYVVWVGRAMLGTPPLVRAEGLRFFHSDPQVFSGREMQLAWEEIREIEEEDGTADRRRGLAFTLVNGKKALLLTAPLENEAEVVQAIRAAWGARAGAGMPTAVLN